MDAQKHIDEYHPEIAEYLRTQLRGEYSLTDDGSVINIDFTDPTDTTMFFIRFFTGE